MNNTMRLQYVGKVKGTQAKDIKPGNVLMWNFGHTSTVKEITGETKDFILIIETSKGIDYPRRLKKTKLVCIVK